MPTDRSEMTTSAGDILQRLRITRATLPELSPQDRTCRDAALAIETLRAENALLKRVVVDLWDHMDDQSCIEFSAIRPRSYIMADEEWQAEKRRREELA